MKVLEDEGFGEISMLFRAEDLIEAIYIIFGTSQILEIWILIFAAGDENSITFLVHTPPKKNSRANSLVRSI